MYLGDQVTQESPSIKAELHTQRYADRQEIQLVEWTSPLEETLHSHGRKLKYSPG